MTAMQPPTVVQQVAQPQQVLTDLQPIQSLSLLIHADSKVGKTTLAATAPRPILALDVAALPGFQDLALAGHAGVGFAEGAAVVQGAAGFGGRHHARSGHGVESTEKGRPCRIGQEDNPVDNPVDNSDSGHGE